MCMGWFEMDDSEFGQVLRRRIEKAYDVLGSGIGWRLLYSPLDTLSTARVAFVGLNPGESEEDEAHATLAMDRGSAYTDECWKNRPPGQQKLQVQVQHVFRTVREHPSRVLAGNLIPFRTAKVADLPDLPAALQFGTDLWLDIINRGNVQTIVTMGRQAGDALTSALGVREQRRIPVGWGSVSGVAATWARGKLIGLPHLSRFAIMGRPESDAAIRDLFDH